MSEILTVRASQGRTSLVKGPQAEHVSSTRREVGRRVSRRSGSAVLRAVLEEPAQYLWVAVSGRVVSGAESKGTLGLDVSAALDQEDRTGKGVVLGRYVNRLVREVVLVVDD